MEKRTVIIKEAIHYFFVVRCESCFCEYEPINIFKSKNIKCPNCKTYVSNKIKNTLSVSIVKPAIKESLDE